MREHLSFTPLSEELILTLTEQRREAGGDGDELCELLSDLLPLRDEGVEAAVCVRNDVLFIRIFDGEYLFPWPVGLDDGWDAGTALTMLADYAVREMIPLVLTEVEREELPLLTSLFSSLNARAYEDDEDLFFIRVENECLRLEELPVRAFGRIRLAPINKKSLRRYAELCKSDEVNKYWGYDFREDEPNARDEYFLRVVNSEFERGVALTLGAYTEGKLIGEGVIYGFDYRGGAEVGLRLLPEYWGQGYGGEIFSALILLAEEIGLSRLRAEVLLSNGPSLALCAKFLHESARDDEKVYYSLQI